MIHLLLLKAGLDTWRGEMWMLTGVDVLDIPWWQTERQGSYGKKYENINKHKQTSTNKSQMFHPSGAKPSIQVKDRPWSSTVEAQRFFHQPTEPGTSLDPPIWYIFSAQPWKLEGFRAGVMTTIAINTVRLGRAGGQSGAPKVKMDKFGADPVYHSYQLYRYTLLVCEWCFELSRVCMYTRDLRISKKSFEWCIRTRKIEPPRARSDLSGIFWLESSKGSLWELLC